MAFRTTLILTLSSAVAAIAVAQPQGSTINFDSNACPDGWSQSQGNNGDNIDYCCPGSSYLDYSPGGVQGCVIGSSTVPFSMAGYTSIVSSLAAEESGGSGGSMTEDSSSSAAEETMTVSSSGEMSSGMTTSMAESGSGAGGSQASATAASSTSGNAAPMMTAAPLLAL
ncbi:hypothetical protein Slin15195_G095510 [Septoria linicola]|uniref:Uncharacterized protein n=1 Tax=Septoria linicola TaxID=215465 RepID=A0A9Q9B2J0_9PEZI|nr:hypothetical protein Slin15195_G095510 [Septoria linicola]